MKSIMARFGVIAGLFLLSGSAFAEVDTSGVLNQVSDRFLAESATWANTIQQYATWLFWTLVLISMVWTFGMMALRKADISEFFAEFVKFTVTTGFFWWLLSNGPSFAIDIINSLRTVGAQASGLPRELNPSTPIDIAFDILAKAANSYSLTAPIDNLSIFITSLLILVCLAVVAANVLLALVTGWVIAYAGIFVLGFGGSRWTSEIAINYFRGVIGIALKMMTITLLVGIAVSIIDGYHMALADKAPMKELLVILVVSVVLVVLVNSIPNVIAGLIPGGGAAASAGSSFGAGALVGAAAGAGAAVATGGAALGAAGTQALGGAQALKAAFQSAQAAESAVGGTGGDLMAVMGGNSTNGGDAGGSVFGDDPSGGRSSGESLTNSAGRSQASEGESGDETREAEGLGGKAAGSDAKEGGSDGGGEKSGGVMAKAGRIAAGTASVLAQGMVSSASSKLQERVADTAGARLAASIQERRLKAESAATASGDDHEPSFQNNSLSSGGIRDEVAEFVNRKPPQE